MTIPKVSLSIKDGGLGVTPPSADNAIVYLGTSSKGPESTLEAFGDPTPLAAAFGDGPLVEAAAFAMATTVNGIAPGPVYVLRVPHGSVTPGTISSVTPTRKSTSVGTLAVAGADASGDYAAGPWDAFSARVKITQTGTLGVAQFQLSLDWNAAKGSGTFGDAITVHASDGLYTVPGTGLVLTFTPGSGAIHFEAGDAFDFTVGAPTYDDTALGTLLDVVLASFAVIPLVHVLGAVAAGSSALVNRVAAVQSKLATGETGGRYLRGIVEAIDTDDNLATALDGASAVRVMVCAGTCRIVSARTSRIVQRSIAWPVGARLAATPVHEDAGRVKSGALANVVSIDRDERLTPNLDVHRYTTLCTILGYQGFWVTNALLLAPTGSDYDLVQNGRVIDKACNVAILALTRFRSDSVRVNPVGSRAPAVAGAIRSIDATSIETYVARQIRDAMNDSITAADVTVNRTDNLLSTRKLRAAIEVTPLAYLKSIDGTISLTNPALAS